MLDRFTRRGRSALDVRLRRPSRKSDQTPSSASTCRTLVPSAIFCCDRRACSLRGFLRSLSHVACRTCHGLEAHPPSRHNPSPLRSYFRPTQIEGLGQVAETRVPGLPHRLLPRQLCRSLAATLRFQWPVSVPDSLQTCFLHRPAQIGLGMATMLSITTANALFGEV